MNKRHLPALILTIGSCLCAPAVQARDEIRAVGSSTVFPFVAMAAEHFGETTKFRTPIVEENGTGGGIALFCSGTAPDTPADIANASRAIKDGERAQCRSHGVTDIIEIPFGADGIVVANARTVAHADFTREQLFLALAKQVPKDGALIDNPYHRWNEIDPALPDKEIEVYGPPPSSGTRDALVELISKVGCGWPEYLAAYPQEEQRKLACSSLRDDGAFIEGREDDNIIVLKLTANTNAFGIFGFSYLDQNVDRVQGSSIEGVEPSFETISDGSYKLSRMLYVYVKKQALGVIPGLAEFARMLVSDEAVGAEGYLSLKGLVPLPVDQQANIRDTLNNQLAPTRN